MTRGLPVIKEILRYAWPAALSSIGSIFVGLTDTAFMGHYSTEGLAGVSMAATIYELPINILLGGLVALRIVAPRLAGLDPSVREQASLRKALRWLAPWVFLSSAALLGLGILLGAMDEWRGSNGAAGEYLLARAFGLAPEVVAAAVTVSLVSWERTRTPLQVFAFSSGINLALDFILVFGLGPVPSLGALGDGVASTAGNVAAMLWVIWIYQRVTSKASGHLSGETLDRAVENWARLNIPSMVSAALDYAGNLVFILTIATAGLSGLASARAAAFVHLLAFSLISSLSGGALYVLGRWGANNTFDESTHRLVSGRFTLIGAVLGGLLALISWPLSMLISPDPDVRSSTLSLSLIVAVVSPLIAFTYAHVTMLRATGNTGSDFVSNTVAVWLAQVPLAVVGCILYQAPGAFIGLVGYWVVRCVFSWYQVRKIEDWNSATELSR